MFAKWVEQDGRFAFSHEDNGGKEISGEYHSELILGEQSGKRITPDNSKYPVLTDPPPPTQEQLKSIEKRKGIEFDGVMCSATAQDMWGLNSVKSWVASGNTVNFHFDNGNTLELTAENIDAFEAVWIPFRASFF